MFKQVLVGNMSMKKYLILLALFCSFIGCQQDEVRSYSVPKEKPNQPMSQMAQMKTEQDPTQQAPSVQQNPAQAEEKNPAPQDQMQMPELPPGHPKIDMNQDAMPGGAGADTGNKASRGVDWQLPSGWTEQPGNSIRVGSFAFTGKNGQKADISVVPLFGTAGGELSNVNRWRGQIGLEPIQDKDLEQNVQRIKPADRAMLLADFASKDPIIDGKFKSRIVVAMYIQPEKTWFFKMTGEDSAVSEAKDSFLKFLESLKFN